MQNYIIISSNPVDPVKVKTICPNFLQLNEGFTAIAVSSEKYEQDILDLLPKESYVFKASSCLFNSELPDEVQNYLFTFNPQKTIMPQFIK